MMIIDFLIAPNAALTFGVLLALGVYELRQVRKAKKFRDA